MSRRGWILVSVLVLQMLISLLAVTLLSVTYHLVRALTALQTAETLRQQGYQTLRYAEQQLQNRSAAQRRQLPLLGRDADVDTLPWYSRPASAWPLGGRAYTAARLATLPYSVELFAPYASEVYSLYARAWAAVPAPAAGLSVYASLWLGPAHMWPPRFEQVVRQPPARWQARIAPDDDTPLIARLQARGIVLGDDTGVERETLDPGGNGAPCRACVLFSGWLEQAGVWYWLPGVVSSRHIALWRLPAAGVAPGTPPLYWHAAAPEGRQMQSNAVVLSRRGRPMVAVAQGDSPPALVLYSLDDHTGPDSRPLPGVPPFSLLALDREGMLQPEGMLITEGSGKLFWAGWEPHGMLTVRQLSDGLWVPLEQPLLATMAEQAGGRIWLVVPGEAGIQVFFGDPQDRLRRCWEKSLPGSKAALVVGNRVLVQYQRMLLIYELETGVECGRYRVGDKNGLSLGMAAGDLQLQACHNRGCQRLGRLPEWGLKAFRQLPAQEEKNELSN